MKAFYFLLAFVPFSLVSEYLHGPALLTFATAALGVVPLAGIIGEATEHLAARTGPRLGGFLNATLGNAANWTYSTLFSVRVLRCTPSFRRSLCGLSGGR